MCHGWANELRDNASDVVSHLVEVATNVVQIISRHLLKSIVTLVQAKLGFLFKVIQIVQDLGLQRANMLRVIRKSGLADHLGCLQPAFFIIEQVYSLSKILKDVFEHLEKYGLHVNIIFEETTLISQKPRDLESQKLEVVGDVLMHVKQVGGNH